MKLSLFAKLLIFSFVQQIIILIIILFSNYSFSVEEQKSDVAKLQELALQNRQYRLELLSRRDSNFINIFQNNTKLINSNLKEFDLIAKKNMDENYFSNLMFLKNQYNIYFEKYIENIQILGLNEDSGIEGSFRSKVHSIENILDNTKNSDLSISMLQARRSEKDFIMRGRDEYINKVKKRINELNEKTLKSALTNGEKEKITMLSGEYMESFIKLVEISKSLQYLDKHLTKLDKETLSVISGIVTDKSTKASEIQSLLIPLYICSIIGSIILSIIIARSITNPIVNLKMATLKIADGELQYKVKVETKDEIGELAKFFNIMVENIYKANQTIINQQDELNNQYIEMRELNATKDKFFSIIAHDLKNPLSAFTGVANFLIERFAELSQEEIKEFLDDVHCSAKQLYELLENLLVWSRSQRGLIQFNPTKLNIKSIIKNNIDLVKMNADAKEIEIIPEINCNKSIYSDPNMLNTILRNLITNAIKFTKNKGKITIQVVEENIYYLRVSVIDNGIGISEKDLDKLFRVDMSHSTEGTSHERGTGLGLILCKEFVEKHGGQIWVESQLGVGSKFIFTIPIDRN